MMVKKIYNMKILQYLMYCCGYEINRGGLFMIAHMLTNTTILPLD